MGMSMMFIRPLTREELNRFATVHGMETHVVANGASSDAYLVKGNNRVKLISECTEHNPTNFKYVGFDLTTDPSVEITAIFAAAGLSAANRDPIVYAFAKVISQFNRTGRSTIPDFILGEYLAACLHAIELSSIQCKWWYNFGLPPAPMTSALGAVPTSNPLEMKGGQPPSCGPVHEVGVFDAVAGSYRKCHLNRGGRATWIEPRIEPLQVICPQCNSGRLVNREQMTGTVILGTSLLTCGKCGQGLRGAMGQALLERAFGNFAIITVPCTRCAGWFAASRDSVLNSVIMGTAKTHCPNCNNDMQAAMTKVVMDAVFGEE